MGKTRKSRKSDKKIKAAIINIFIITMDEMTMCNVNGSIIVTNPQRINTKLQFLSALQGISAYCLSLTAHNLLF